MKDCRALLLRRPCAAGAGGIAAALAIVCSAVLAAPRTWTDPALSGLRGPAEVRTRTDIRLGDHPLQAMDVYIPSKPNSAAVIAIHGGAWRAGDKAGMALVSGLLATHGFLVASVNYRLAPQFHWPAQLEDCQLAVEWLHKRAGELGIDSKRIGAIGMSAGGHLAAMLTLIDGELARRGKVAAGCDYFGPSDLRVAARQDSFVFGVLVDLIGKPFDQAPDVYAAASPITWVDPNDPPLQICHGAKDQVVRPVQSTMLYEALKQKGVQTELIMLDNHGHGFNGLLGQDKDVDDCMRRSIEWLKKSLLH
ncbi:MAG: alpha/beta hydrolase [Armatimonadetes bacterium]|nr:alpha/beta hydrolase [Armatimonadota bacterium]